MPLLFHHRCALPFETLIPDGCGMLCLEVLSDRYFAACEWQILSLFLGRQWEVAVVFVGIGCCMLLAVLRQD